MFKLEAACTITQTPFFKANTLLLSRVQIEVNGFSLNAVIHRCSLVEKVMFQPSAFRIELLVKIICTVLAWANILFGGRALALNPSPVCNALPPSVSSNICKKSTIFHVWDASENENEIDQERIFILLKTLRVKNTSQKKRKINNASSFMWSARENKSKSSFLSDFFTKWLKKVSNKRIDPCRHNATIYCLFCFLQPPEHTSHRYFLTKLSIHIGRWKSIIIRLLDKKSYVLSTKIKS